MVDYDEERHDEGRDDDAIAYSDEELLTQKDFSNFTNEDMEQAREIIAKLAERLATKLSRRKVTGKNGRTIDFRQSWRKNLVYAASRSNYFGSSKKLRKTKFSCSVM